MSEPRTIIDHLLRRAALSPDALHARYVHADRAPDEQSYGELELAEAGPGRCAA